MANVWKVPKLWEGGDCWIIGGGHSLPYQFDVPQEIINDVCNENTTPAAYRPYMEPIFDKHIIGVNDAYRLGDWIDFLFFGDTSWYLKHRISISKWAGIKITCSPRFAQRKPKECDGIKYLQKDHNHRLGISPNRSKVAWNNNSGSAAISLASHLGVKRIFLLGFDMNKQNKASHWHLGNGRKKNPPFARHMKGFPAIAKDAEKLGIKIYNVNTNSAIKEFPKITLQEALNGN